MDRSDRIGLGAALVLHLGLFGALSVSLLSRRTPPAPPPPSVDVSLVEEIGFGHRGRMIARMGGSVCRWQDLVPPRP